MNKKVRGWMLRTHVLLSLCALLGFMLIPLPLFQNIFGVLKENVLLFITALVITAGGALLPDLDNNKSSAGAKLGAIGSMLTTFMKSSSQIVWNIYHWKGDRRPQNQHRYLWHTPIIGIGMILLFYFLFPTRDTTIFDDIRDNISNGNIGQFIIHNTVLFIFILLVFAAVFVGSDIIVYRLSKFFQGLPNVIKLLFPFVVLFYIIGFLKYPDIRILAICLGTGYLLHCLEDVLVDSGICLFWPIPNFFKKKVWQKVHLPLGLKTGGTVNKIIDIILLPLLVLLIVLVFKGGN